MSFAKVHDSLLDSSVWTEDDKTRLVWVTMMVMADRDGIVAASVPGLAHRARVSRRACEDALNIFLAPDPDSRTPDSDGRRIEKVAGGWRLLNHAAYREKDSIADVRAKNAERQQRFRDKQRGDVTLRNVTVTHDNGGVTGGDGGNDIAETETDPNTETERASGEPALDVPVSWRAPMWLRRFGLAWAAAKGTQSYGKGTDDAIATRELQEILDTLTHEERIAAEGIAPQMFARYFENPKATGHPFKWFVQRFNEWRTPPPRPDGRTGWAPAEVKPRPNGEVKL